MSEQFESNVTRNKIKGNNRENDWRTNFDPEKARKYVAELVEEKHSIDTHKLPVSARLLEEEISSVQAMGRERNKYVDLYRDVPVKVTSKVLVPVKQFPKFNFVGKLLGPKGSTMKRLQEETMCKISILGKGSMRNLRMEEEYKASLDPKYSHLSEDLHVKITAFAKPVEAHARIAFALEEIKQYLVPDRNDEIGREQSHQLRGMGGQIPKELVNNGWKRVRTNFPDRPEKHWRDPSSFFPRSSRV